VHRFLGERRRRSVGMLVYEVERKGKERKGWVRKVNKEAGPTWLSVV
jgi:hypothetical protein